MLISLHSQTVLPWLPCPMDVDRTMLAIKHTKYMNFPLEYCILFMNTLILDLYITFIMMPFS